MQLYAYVLLYSHISSNIFAGSYLNRCGCGVGALGARSSPRGAPIQGSFGSRVGAIQCPKAVAKLFYKWLNYGLW